MASPRYSERLQSVWNGLLDASNEQDVTEEKMAECADSCCTTGYDSDGSTGVEIFENGFGLAEQAAGRPVFSVNDREEDVAYFFIGTEDEIEAKLRAALA